MPVVTPHVRRTPGPRLELRPPGVVVCHVVPLPEVRLEAPPGGEVGGVAVAQVPLPDLFRDRVDRNYSNILQY